MQTAITTHNQEDPIIRLSRDFSLVSAKHAHRFVYELMPKWYAAWVENLIEYQDAVPVPALGSDLIYEVSEIGDEATELMRLSFYDELILTAGFPSDFKDWTEQIAEEAEEAMSDQAQEIDYDMLQDMEVAMDFLGLFYLHNAWSMGSGSERRIIIERIHCPIVEVW